MTRQISAILVGFMLLVFPMASDGQNGDGELPARDGDEIQAEADGKRSKKVKISDAVRLDLSGLPEVPLKYQALHPDDVATLDQVERYVPGLGAKIKADLPKITNLRDRLVYFAERLAKLQERLDYLEANNAKGLVGEHAIWSAKRARAAVLAMDITHTEEMSEALHRTYPKEVADHFMKVYDLQSDKYLEALLKQQEARRKSLGLPPKPKSGDK